MIYLLEKSRMQARRITISQWAVEDRPREKMINNGRHVLSDAELLAILIGSGNINETAVDLGRNLLQFCDGDLNRLGRLQLAELTKIKGIGPSKAAKLMAALELGRRRAELPITKKNKLITSYDCYLAAKSLYQDIHHEEFHVLFLRRNGEVICSRQVSKGGISGTYVDPKIVFKIAFETSAASIVLTHNHPGGHLKPSFSDRELTRNIIEFGKMIKLDVLDHIILTDIGYFSFADNGILV